MASRAQVVHFLADALWIVAADREVVRLAEREGLRGVEREELLWPVEAHAGTEASMRQIAKASFRIMLSDYFGGLGREQ